MRKSTVDTAIFGVLSALAVGLAGVAVLSMCTITGAHGLSNTDAAGNQIVPDQFDTAYGDVDCPADN